MAYDVKLTPTAEKDLSKFDPELQRHFYKKVEKLKEYPDIYGKPLKHDLAGKWELRFEKRWRIVYVINQKDQQVQIEAIWHKDDF